MASDNDEDKELSGDDLRNLKMEEEIKSEAEEKEGEDLRPPPRATIASIGVVENSFKVRRRSMISAGRGVPRHQLARGTRSSRNKNRFRALIHEYQSQKVPKSKLPSGWDIYRSNNAGSSQSEEGWGNNSKSWDSQSDKFMNRIEHNTEMIRLLTYKIDELKELVEKLVKDSSPPKE